jgi:putative ABC transport system permease protein
MALGVMLRLAARYIDRRLLQSILFVLGVALGVAMMVAIDLANGSSSRAFALSTRSVTGSATHQILGGPSGLPNSLFRDLRVGLGLEEIAPVVETFVRVAELGDVPLRLFGVDPFSEPPFREYLSQVNADGTTAEGAQAFEAFNQFLTEPNTVILSADLAARHGVAVGDSVTLRLPAGAEQVRIIGLIEAEDESSREALNSLIIADIATAQALIGRPNELTRIDLILPDGYDTAAITALLPAGAVLQTSDRQAGALAQMTAAFELNLQALSLLALVFLIYNTVSFSVIQRRPVIGTLRALGASKRQIFTLVVGEALILGVFGTIVGLALGIVFGRAAVGVIAQTISDLFFTVSVQGVAVEPLTLVRGAVIGVAASLLAAAIPSLDATRTPPAGAMRRSLQEEAALRLLPVITGAAVLLCAVGVVLLGLPTQSLIVSFAALFSIVVGGALFTPVVLIALMRLAAPLTGGLFGIVGRMAPRAVVRALSRTSVAVAALTVAVSVIVGVTVMVNSFRGTVADWLDVTLGADIYLSPPSVTATRATADLDPALAETLRAVPGVGRVVTGRNVNALAPAFPDLPPVNLTIADGEVVSGERRFVWTAYPPADPADPDLAIAPYWPALRDGAVMVSEPFAFRRGITQEENTLTLLTDRGEVTFPVIGVYFDYTTEQGTVFMADTVYRAHYDDRFISTLAVFLTPEAAADPARRDGVFEAVRAAAAGTELVVQSNRALRQGAFEVFERTFAITGALQLLSVVVAFIGILSALMALQIEGTRQHGVMRAVGMTGGEMWRYTLLQTGLMGFSAGALAMPIGVVLAWVLIYVINVRSFGWTMQLTLTPGEFALAFGVAVFASLAAGIYPARRLSQLPPAMAVRSE